MSVNGTRGPIESFLGEEEAKGGPFALLGLPPADVGEQIVLSALERQLERVSAHREGDTPAADEVRLALHASAAQLLDERVRRQLVVLWGGRVDPNAPSQPRAAISNRPLEHDAILTLGMYGGWNRRSLRRLLQLAHARGMDNHEVAATLSRLAKRRVPARPKRARPVKRGAPDLTPEQQQEADALAEQQDPMVGYLKVGAGIGALVLVLAIGAAIIITMSLQSGSAPEEDLARTPAPREDPDEVVSIFDRGQAAPTMRASEPEVEPDVDMRNEEIALRLQEAIEGLEFDVGQSRADFLGSVEALSTRWVKLPEDQLVASNQRVVEYVYRTSTRADLSREVIEAIASGSMALEAGDESPSMVLEATWSVGMLARLSRERDLSAMAEGLIRRHLGAALGHAGGVSSGTFNMGALGALNVMAGRMAAGGGASTQDRIQSWGSWLEGVEAVTSPGSLDRERVILSAVETIMSRGPEPSADKATFDAIGLLVSRLDWGKDAEAREWLVRWFADRRVSSDDLHAVTMALVTKTRAPGVTQLMTLSPAASDRARTDLREQYVVTWGFGESVRMEGLLADWAQAARDALTRQPTERSDQLEQAVRLSRLNEVASLLWRGHSSDADALLEGVELPLEMMREQAEARDVMAPSSPEQATDGRWALRYLQAGSNIPVRMRLLNDLAKSRSRLGAVDAEVLTQEAIRGSPREIRDKARQIAIAHANDPDVVNGVLEQLPWARRDAETDDLIQRVALAPLPAIRSPDWPVAARRGLVERLLELTAARGEYAWVDALSRQLAASYENRAAAQPITDEVPLTRTPPAAHESASALWQVWLAGADQSRPVAGSSMPVEELGRRRAGRISLAQGLVQRFAAEQVSVCELMGLVVASERPGGSTMIELVLADMSDRRRRAAHIFEQLEAAERAMLRLWLLRLTEGPV